MQNEIISLTQIEEELWSYHPDNKDRIDIKTSHRQIKDQIFEIELKIDELTEEIKTIRSEGDLSDPKWDGFDHLNENPHKDK